MSSIQLIQTRNCHLICFGILYYFGIGFGQCSVTEHLTCSRSNSMEMLSLPLDSVTMYFNVSKVVFIYKRWPSKLFNIFFNGWISCSLMRCPESYFVVVGLVMDSVIGGIWNKATSNILINWKELLLNTSEFRSLGHESRWLGFCLNSIIKFFMCLILLVVN